MTAPEAALRRDLEPFVCVRGPAPGDGGLRAVVRAGDLDVDVVQAHDRSIEASCAVPATGLYVDVLLTPLATLELRSSDLPYAQALVATTESRLARTIANGGSAQLRFGTWRVRSGRPAPSARQVIDVVVALALRPQRLAERWHDLASELGSSWRGTWGTHGETAFVVPTRDRAVTVEVRAVANADGIDQIHTCLVGADRRTSSRPGVIDDALALAAAIRELTGAELAIGAPRVRTAVAAPPAPLAFADWPATRTPSVTRRRGWQPGPAIGSDPRRGLDERVVIDDIAVTTRCSDEAQVATAISAPADGLAGLRLKARPGYRFLRGLFVAEPRLDDAAFDDRYVLDVDDLAWARWWFGADERAAIAATFHAEAAHPFAFALADAQVAFTAEAAPVRGYLDAARHAAAFLAARDRRATAEWRQLANRLGATVLGTDFHVDGGLVARTGRGAATIELTTALRDARLVTVARAGTAAPDEHRHLTIRADRVAAPLEPARGRRDPSIDGPDDHTTRASDAAWARAHVAALAPVLAAARPALIEVTGDRVEVTWAGPLLDATRLAAGVDLVARVTRHGAIAADPYR